VAMSSDRALHLILKYCTGGATRYGALIKAGSDSVKALPVTLRLNQLKRLLDIELTAPQVKSLLAPLGFESGEESAGTITVSVPSFRQGDVTREIDIVEEVSRLYGYDKIEERMPSATAAPEPLDDLEARVREALTAQGLSEAWVSSLTRPSEF